MKRIALLFFSLLLPCAAQNVVPGNPSQQLNVVSGAPYFFTNSEGAGTITFAYSFTGTPSGVSITVQGCAQDGTNCTTLTPITGSSPYTTAASGQQQFIFGYAQAKVTATFSGTTLNIYKVGVTAKVGGAGGGGGATFPSTAGVVCNTSTTASQNCGSSDLVTALNNSPSSTLSPSLIPSATTSTKGAIVLPQNAGSNYLGNLSSLKPNAALWGFGTSYMCGSGVPLNALGPCGSPIASFFGLMERDTPGAWKNNATVGWQTWQIATSVVSNFVANAYGSTLATMDAGENDQSGSTAIDPTYFGNMIMFQDAWVTIPLAYHQFAATATSTQVACTNGGGWSSGYTSPIVNGIATTVIGWQATSAGRTITCTVPASNTGTKVGLNYAYNGTGAFIASYTSTSGSGSFTDNCSNSTTFTEVACSASVASGNAPARQEFTIPANVAVTITFTTTGTGRTDILGIDWLPPAYNATTGTLGVAGQSVVIRNTTLNGIFAAYATVNAAIATETATLRADGLPVFLDDLNAAQGSVPAINGATCVAGSSLANHPNAACYAQWEAHDLATQAANNYVVSSQNAGNPLAQFGNINAPLTGYIANLTTTDTGFWTPCLNFVGCGIYTYSQGASRIGIRSGTDASAGLPWSGAQVQELFANSGRGKYHCFANFNASQTPAESNFTNSACIDDTNGNFLTLGMVVPSGTAPAIAVGPAAGTGGSVGATITGTNMAGRISITTGSAGTPVSSATLATITFNGTLGTAPQGCFLQPVGANANGQVGMVALGGYPSTTTWTIAVAGSPIPDSATYTYAYHCI